jgi:uncharacterized protein YaiL (DUF2058 family)
MQNLREQLLKAGLITEEQISDADARAEKEQAKKKRAPGKPRREEKKEPDRPKLSKKQLMKQPLNRMLDLSDPRLLKIFQAIEEHRLREDAKGEMPFHFTLRDGHVRKIMLTEQVVRALEKGELAIVESGEKDRHVIVRAEAVPIIREADADAVRFANTAEE